MRLFIFMVLGFSLSILPKAFADDNEKVCLTDMLDILPTNYTDETDQLGNNYWIWDLKGEFVDSNYVVDYSKKSCEVKVKLYQTPQGSTLYVEEGSNLLFPFGHYLSVDSECEKSSNSGDRSVSGFTRERQASGWKKILVTKLHIFSNKTTEFTINYGQDSYMNSIEEAFSTPSFFECTFKY